MHRRLRRTGKRAPAIRLSIKFDEHLRGSRHRGFATKGITKETMDLVAVRHLMAGFNFRAHTPHGIAHELMRWDEEFRDANCTQLVEAVTLWQSSSCDQAMRPAPYDRRF